MVTEHKKRYQIHRFSLKILQNISRFIEQFIDKKYPIALSIFVHMTENSIDSYDFAEP